jgi:hypothetical protein
VLEKLREEGAHTYQGYFANRWLRRRSDEYPVAQLGRNNAYWRREFPDASGVARLRSPSGLHFVQASRPVVGSAPFLRAFQLENPAGTPSGVRAFLAVNRWCRSFLAQPPATGFDASGIGCG